MKDVIIGIDIGGTHLRIGAVDAVGQVSCFEKRESREVCGEGGSAQRLVMLIRDYLARYGLAGRARALAVGFPATVSRDKRTVYSSPNLPLGGEGGLPLVVVDYAHTPDALEKVLTALRPHARGQLVCLFGCGGERDRGKRALMAQVAERLADRVVATDDNPRNEPAEQILEDIRQGFAQPERVQFRPGRGAAIAAAIAAAQPEDVVLLAGKGHEDYQEICGVRQPFSDLDEARKALAAWEKHDA